MWSQTVQQCDRLRPRTISRPPVVECVPYLARAYARLARMYFERRRGQIWSGRQFAHVTVGITVFRVVSCWHLRLSRRWQVGVTRSG